MKKIFYKNFSDPTKTFYKSETRAFCWDLSCKLIEIAKRKDPQNWYTHILTIKGILLLLYCWNFAANKTKKLKKWKVKKAIQNSISELRFLEKYNLLTIDESCDDKIKKIYKEFLNPFDQTGASKALCLLNPELFVMWDTKIRAFLRKSLIQGINNGEKSEHYILYLKKLNEFAIKYNLNKKISGKGTLAKKLDEYHYLKIVLKKKKI